MRTVRSTLAAGALTLALTALTLAGCGTAMSVRSDHDRGASFTGFDSYVWVESADSSGVEDDLGFDSELMARRIQEMVHAELASLGYVRGESRSARPDFAISYSMVAREEMEHVDLGHGGHSYSPHRHRGFGHGGHGFGHGGHGHGGHGHGGRSGFTRDIVKCILVLDVRDPETDRLLWRGWARWHLDDDPSPEKVTRHLARAVEEILGRFPPERVSATAGVPELAGG